MSSTNKVASENTWTHMTKLNRRREAETFAGEIPAPAQFLSRGIHAAVQAPIVLRQKIITWGFYLE